MINIPSILFLSTLSAVLAQKCDDPPFTKCIAYKANYCGTDGTSISEEAGRQYTEMLNMLMSPMLDKCGINLFSNHVSNPPNVGWVSCENDGKLDIQYYLPSSGCAFEPWKNTTIQYGKCQAGIVGDTSIHYQCYSKSHPEPAPSPPQPGPQPPAPDPSKNKSGGNNNSSDGTDFANLNYQSVNAFVIASLVLINFVY